MPKCLECGFEATRLQWTHFKYKCTGRFINGTEYKKVYPNAKVVDDDLAERTSITEKNLINKYGPEEGKKRWISYCDKQRKSNGLEYKQKKHGWSEVQFDEFNKSRAITLEKCIERHGEEEGRIKWDIYRDAQRYTNTLEYYIEKYGDKGKEEWQKYNSEKGKSSTIEWIMEKHCVDELGAEEILSKRTPTRYTSNLELDFIDQLELDLGYKIKYTAKTRQFCMWNQIDHVPVFFDIVDDERRKIIEFHGDYWHCNPMKYSPKFVHPHCGMTSEEIWKRDHSKLQTALDRGFVVKIVWENDYKNNPQKTIKEAKEWLISDTPQYQK